MTNYVLTASSAFPYSINTDFTSLSGSGTLLTASYGVAIPLKPIKNIIIDRSVGEYIKNNYTLFVQFLEAYYEWMEFRQRPNEVAQNFLEYVSLDQTLDGLLSHFRNEFLIDFPDDVITDKRLLIKNIRKFYANKGNEDSYKFLFRILFNEDIELYYPKNNILRASDGKWIQTTSIKIAPPTAPYDYLFTSSIQGATSNAYATVQSINTVNEQGRTVLELILASLYGQFSPGETLILNPVPSANPTITVEDVYTGFQFSNGGTLYQINDKILVKDYAGNIQATGRVTQIGRGPIEALTTDNGGANYKGLYEDISNFMYLPMTHDFYGYGALGSIAFNTVITEDGSIAFGDEIISHTIPTVTVYTGYGDPIIITDADNVGTGAGGVVYHVTDTGAIYTVALNGSDGAELLTAGQNYGTPTATVSSTTGSGAVISVTGGGGSIIAAQLNNFPVVNRTDGNSNTLTIDFSQGHGIDAVATLLDNAGQIIYPGYYMNSDGMLSSDMYLQDNYYYQDYSYVVRSGISSTVWASKVLPIIHPAGLQSFGELKFSILLPENPSESVVYVNQTVV